MERLKAYHDPEFLNSPEARTVRLLAEYLEPESRFDKFKIRDTIVFFGSARIMSSEKAQAAVDLLKCEAQAEGCALDALNLQMRRAERDLKNARFYQDATVLARMLTSWSKEKHARDKNGPRYIVCSGGGPGIMEAANRGASEAGGYSIGLNISLPFEQDPNPYISEELSFEFHYFFIRKFWFVYPAKALVVFPGGFGTIDEMMELLTLIQTKKLTKKVPVILYGKEFWQAVINFDVLVEWGLISPDDLKLFRFADTPEEAFACLSGDLEAGPAGR